MGGVDLVDILIVLYRVNITTIKTHLPLCSYSKIECLAPLSKALSTKRNLKEIADENEKLHKTNLLMHLSYQVKIWKERLVSQDEPFRPNQQWEEIQLFQHQWQRFNLTKWCIGLRLMGIVIVVGNVIWHTL